jgi:hypothetical protein
MSHPHDLIQLKNGIAILKDLRTIQFVCVYV